MRSEYYCVSYNLTFFKKGTQWKIWNTSSKSLEYVFLFWQKKLSWIFHVGDCWFFGCFIDHLFYGFFLKCSYDINSFRKVCPLFRMFQLYVWYPILSVMGGFMDNLELLFLIPTILWESLDVWFIKFHFCMFCK